MIELLSQFWPWYIAGPLIGLTVPLLYLLFGQTFGLSSSLKHICAATLPADIPYFQYAWKQTGLWNLLFVVGIMFGGFLAVTLFPHPDPVIGITAGTKEQLQQLGITNFPRFLPPSIFSWSGLLSVPGLIIIAGGGFLIGFGSRYAGGCTSGHGISGLAGLQIVSLIAVAGFFAGGLFVTHIIFPLLLSS